MSLRNNLVSYHRGCRVHHSAASGVVEVLPAVLGSVPVHPLQVQCVHRDGEVAGRQSARLGNRRHPRLKHLVGLGHKQWRGVK